MKRWHFLKRLSPVMALMVLLLSACGRSDLSTLNPQGPIAQEQYNLMLLSIGIMLIVVIVVFLLVIISLLRFRRRKGDNTIPKQVEGNHKLEIIWTVIPVILLIILAVPTVQTVFSQAKDYSEDPDAVQIHVTAHQYWWEFEYPQYGITTAQEMLIPTGKTISLTLKSNDVKHSFWVPALAGKIDTNPTGNVNKMYLSAPKEGVYLGKCAEFCGDAHSLMDFKVKAVNSASFDRWVAAIQDPVSLPSDPAIAQAFESKCLTCHAVGDYGGPIYPNLTGIGSRETVGGILVNTDNPEYKNEGTTYDNLRRWIENPDAIKPDNQMGIIDLTEQELDGISRYLSELKLNYE